MIVMDMHFEDGTVRREQYALPAIAGRNRECEIFLRSWRVARRHARFVRRVSGVFIEDLGSLAGTYVNGMRISEYGPLAISDEILMGPCRMVLCCLDATEHVDAPDCLTVTQDFACSNVQAQDAVSVDAICAPTVGERESAADASARAMTHTADGAKTVPQQLPSDRYLQCRLQVHSRLLQALDLRRKDISQMSDAALRQEAAALLDQIIAEYIQSSDDIDCAELKQDVLDEAIGLGPLEPLLADPLVTEIMVNRYDEIYVEKAGRLGLHPGSFSSEKSVRGIIDRIVAPLGRRIDESSPMVDARLKDGSRVNAVIPPIALRGANLTIRKFPDFRPGMNDLLALGTLDACMQQFLQLCIEHRKNLIVSGGTGSGKTTLLNILSNCIPDHERIITIEDAAELRLNHSHLIALEARPANIEGKGQILIRDLVRNALRMRPDRIVVGECRGAEAFDMLSAMNTGHEGSMTTLHANSPRDALARLETMILMAGMELPLSAVREHIAASIDFVIQQSRLSSGRRVITSITEICGLESGVIKSQEIFRFDRKGNGAFMGNGIVPDCFGSLIRDGLQIDVTIFNQSTAAVTTNTFVLSQTHRLPNGRTNSVDHDGSASDARFSSGVSA